MNIAGERLSLLALVNTYGIKGVTAQSARYKSMTVEDGAAILSFENDKMNLYGKNSSFTSHLFEIAGPDRVFYPAKVEIYKRKYLKVSAPEVTSPAAVRYAFHNWADGDLVCDAINTAMRELFLQIVYGRTQSAFSENGLAVGASLEDLGKGLRSQVGRVKYLPDRRAHV